MKIKSTFPILFICFSLILIWFKDGLIIGGGEAGLLLFNPEISFNVFRDVWLNYNTGASTLGYLSNVPFLFLAKYLSVNLLIPNFVIQAFLLFTLMIIGCLSVYKLVELFGGENSSNRAIPLISAVFYLLNPYSLSQVWGRGIYAQYFSFALLPLTLLLLLYGFRKRDYTYALLISTASFILSASFGLVTFVIVFWFLIFIFTVHWLWTHKDIKNIKFLTIFILVTAISWALLNSFWLLPLIIGTQQFYNGNLINVSENLGTLLGVSEHFTPSVIIRLLQKNYFFIPNSFNLIYSSFWFQLISALPVAVLFTGIYLIVKKADYRKYVFFLILGTIGLFVSLGANPPFGVLFVYIFKKITFLQAFRNPYEKFGLVYLIGYAVIYSVGLNFILNKFKKTWLIIFPFILINVVFIWPMWTGQVVAGPDNKIGVAVPGYYRDFNIWLSQNLKGGVVLMTPYWAGDGAFYNWDGRVYQGADPMIYLFDAQVISNGAKTPFYYDFSDNLRKYMGRIDLSFALSLLRVEYIVNREDASSITESEREHIKYLTESIFVLSDNLISLKSVCKDTQTIAQQGSRAYITCKLSEDDLNLSGVKYLRFIIKTSSPSYLEIAIKDRKENRIRWDGRSSLEYSTDLGDYKEIVLPISSPSEGNNKLDFSNIYMIEVLAHKKDNPHLSAEIIDLEGVYLDFGQKQKINTFEYLNTFGKLSVYQNLKEVAEEIESPKHIKKVNSYPELFSQDLVYGDQIRETGFLISSNNEGKGVNDLSEGSLSIEKYVKKSNTLYEIKISGKGEGWLALNKTFDSGWKVMPMKDKNIINNKLKMLEFIEKNSLSEDRHFVLNGYANLWRIDSEGDYLLIYKPQNIADISMNISLYAFLLIVSCLIIMLFIKKYNKNSA